MSIVINSVGRLTEVIINGGQPYTREIKDLQVTKVSDTHVQIIPFDAGAIAIEDITIDGDVPSDYDDLKTKLALVFPKASAGGGASDWGDLGGTLSAQTDLQDALDDKADTADLTAHADNISNPHSVTKTQVGLGSADNTTDANKPVSSAAQIALNSKADLVGGVVPSAQIPAIAVTEFLGTSANQAAMLALTGQKGDWTVRTDDGKVYVITGTDPTQVGDWTVLSYPADTITSVNSQTGVVTLAKSDIGLGNVDNTSNATERAATATLTNKTLTSPVINTPSGIVKGDVGLGNVDNTSNATERAATATLTNKRITARYGSTTSSATPTINTDNVDVYELTAQAEDITSFTTNLTGTPTTDQTLHIIVTGTASRALTFGASFESSLVSLPQGTVGTDRLDIYLVYTAGGIWRCGGVF